MDNELEDHERKEVITLPRGLTGNVAVTAWYRGNRNMQTGIAVHDTDMEQGTIMNDNTSRKEKQVNAITRATLIAVLVTLGVALAAPVRAAETEVITAQTPWRVFLRMGPYVGRKDGALVSTVGHNRESRPGDFAKAEFLKDWTARHTPAPADGWIAGDFDDNTWGRYQTDELRRRMILPLPQAEGSRVRVDRRPVKETITF